MELKIWEDGDGKRHTSLGGTEISGVLRSLTLVNYPHQPSQVRLDVLPSCIKVIAEAEVSMVVDGREYHLKE